MAALVSYKSVDVSGVHNRYFAVRHGQVIVYHSILLLDVLFLIAERIKCAENISIESNYWITILWINRPWKGTSPQGSKTAVGLANSPQLGHRHYDYYHFPCLVIVSLHILGNQYL